MLSLTYFGSNGLEICMKLLWNYIICFNKKYFAAGPNLISSLEAIDICRREWKVFHTEDYK